MHRLILFDSFLPVFEALPTKVGVVRFMEALADLVRFDLRHSKFLRSLDYRLSEVFKSVGLRSEREAFDLCQWDSVWEVKVLGNEVTWGEIVRYLDLPSITAQ